MNKKLYIALLILLSSLCGFFAGQIFLKSLTILSNSDFHVYYYIPKAVFILNRPEHPYSNFVPLYPYFFPPASLVLFRALLVFPFITAKLLWTLLNFLLLLMSLKYIFKTFEVKSTLLFLILLSVSLIFMPLKFTIEDGQFNLVLLFVLSYGLYSLTSNRGYKLSGILFGIGTVTKITPVLLLFYSVYKKKFITGFFGVVTIVLLCVAAEYMVKPGINYYYVRHVLSKVSSQSHENTWTDQSVLGLLKNFEFKSINLNVGNRLIKLNKNHTRALISYSIVAFIIAVFVMMELFLKKNVLNTHISYLILTTIGVTGSGLTWFHQYTVLLLPLFSLLLIAIYKLKRPLNYVYILISGIIFLSWVFWLKDTPLPSPILEKNMLLGAFLLLAGLFALKALQTFLPIRVKEVPTISKYPLFLSGILFVIISINPFTLSQVLKEGRDSARIKNLTYIGKVLQKYHPTFQIGSANSYIKTEKLDEGYVLLAKDEDSKLRDDLSILFLDPINDSNFNYQFESLDSENFELKAEMESNKYLEIYGKHFIYSSSSVSE